MYLGYNRKKAGKARIRISFLLLAILMLCCTALPAWAAAYDTYTFDIFGDPVKSPDVYTPYKAYTGRDMGMSSDFGDPRDIVVDDENNVYIADAGANKIYIFSEYMYYKAEISTFVNEEGVRDSLSSPNGVFVSSDKIYVADTDNQRIVVFDRNRNFLYQIGKPESSIIPLSDVYTPVALAVDNVGRIYVISSTTIMGVIVLDADGVFQNFIGAQASSGGLLDRLLSTFRSNSVNAQSTTNVSKELNNITIDENGFLYVTTSSIDEDLQAGSIRSKEGTYQPVKKLNASGDEVMARNGFFAPSGEVDMVNMYDQNLSGASTIVDVAVGPEGTWSIIDDRRSKVYTYDDEGNLLFAFGDKGQLLGNIQTVSGITYQGSKMLLLDKALKNITVYNRTEYGDVLISALRHNNQREYDVAVDDWNTILQYNNNFDSAYVGIGRSYFRSGEWEKAMEYFKAAYDDTNYSNSFGMWRQAWVSKYVLVIPLVVIVFFVIVAKYFGWAAKVNKATAVKTGQRTFKEEFLYSAHVIFHPFDGFWDLKHEKRGSVRAAIVFLMLTVLAYSYSGFGSAYLFGGGYSTSLLRQVIGVVLPIFLFVVANWCLTTLFEGEGSLKDIFIATGYAVSPLPIFIVIRTLLTHVMVMDEAGILNTLMTVAFVWVGFLLFFGIMVTHDYQLFKNILMIVATIVGMAFIMFVVILFSSLIGKIIGFVANIVTELSFRA